VLRSLHSADIVFRSGVVRRVRQPYQRPALDSVYQRLTTVEVGNTVAADAEICEIND
jgi:hypothetical protein